MKANNAQLAFPGMTTPAAERPTARPSYSVIYEPAGRAREYAALACNVYRGCAHRCSYCYSPSATQRSVADFGNATTRSSSFLDNVDREAARHEAHGFTGRVLLSFTCDPYQPLDVEQQVTRRVINCLHRHGLNVQVLSKGGSRALRDVDLFGPADAYAASLTCLDNDESLLWEPGAALPEDRIETLRRFHAAGIPTWVSLEPVLNPASALEIIRQTSPFVDLFKVGKLNHHSLAATIDWRTFGTEAVHLLKSQGRREIGQDDTLPAGATGFYVKDDLRACMSKPK